MDHAHLNDCRRGGVLRLACLASLIIVCGVVGQTSLKAQDALRASLAGEAASRARKVSDAQTPYNIKAGPVSIRFGAGIGFEYNDNIGVTSGGGQTDLITRPSANMTANWPVTEFNQINFSVSFGYAKYLNNPQFDTFNVQATPDTGLSFDVFIGDVRINLHDRFSYQQNPLGEGSLSGGVNSATNTAGSASFGVAQNTVGISADWDLNRLTLSVGYDHNNTFNLSPSFSNLDRAADYFFVRGTMRATEALATGLEATYGLTSYEQNVQNDSRQFTIGPFADWRLSEFIHLTARIGYLISSYDQTGTSTNASTTPSYYGSLEIDHRLNNFISHRLSVGENVQQGVNSDSVAVFSVNYGLSWRAFRLTTISPSFTYEHGKQAGLATIGETYDRIATGIGFGFQLTQKLVSSLNYGFTRRTSNLAGRDYVANTVGLNFTYNF